MGARSRAAAGAGIAFALIVVLLLLGGCTAAQVAVAPDAPRVRAGTQAPGAGYEQLGAVTAKHGGGCGLYGTRGDYEGAYNILRNKAAQLGADYVQIIRVTEPRLEGICMNQSYVLDGIAYRQVSATQAPVSPVATPPKPRHEGLSGTYSGEITGNSEGRILDDHGRHLWDPGRGADRERHPRATGSPAQPLRRRVRRGRGS